MKLSLNARARTVSESYLTAVSLGHSNPDLESGAHQSPLKSSTRGENKLGQGPNCQDATRSRRALHHRVFENT